MGLNSHTKGRTRTRAVALPGVEIRTLAVQLPPTAASNVETPLGVKIPGKSLVISVVVDMATGASSATPLIDVGTLSTASGGDADGFLVGLNVATDGVKAGSMLASARTRGALTFVGSAASQFFDQYALIDIDRDLSFTARGVTNAQKGEVVVVYLKL